MKVFIMSVLFSIALMACVPSQTLTLTPTITPSMTPSPTATPTITPTATLTPSPTPTATTTPMVFKNHRDAYDYLYANNLCIIHNDVPNPFSQAYLDYTVKILNIFKASPEFIFSGLAEKTKDTEYYLGSGADGGCWRIIEFSGSGRYLAMWYQDTETTWTRVIVQEK